MIYEFFSLLSKLVFRRSGLLGGRELTKNSNFEKARGLPAFMVLRLLAAREKERERESDRDRDR